MTEKLFSLKWWEQRESNPRPSACKADALNQLSYAPVKELVHLSNGSAKIVKKSYLQAFYENYSPEMYYICTSLSVSDVLHGDVLVLTASDIGQ